VAFFSFNLTTVTWPRGRPVRWHGGEITIVSSRGAKARSGTLLWARSIARLKVNDHTAASANDRPACQRHARLKKDLGSGGRTSGLFLSVYLWLHPARSSILFDMGVGHRKKMSRDVALKGRQPGIFEPTDGFSSINVMTARWRIADAAASW